MWEWGERECGGVRACRGQGAQGGSGGLRFELPGPHMCSLKRADFHQHMALQCFSMRLFWWLYPFALFSFLKLQDLSCQFLYELRLTAPLWPFGSISLETGRNCCNAFPHLRERVKETSTISVPCLCVVHVDEDQSPWIFLVFLSLKTRSDKNVSLLWSPGGVKPFPWVSVGSSATVISTLQVLA